MFQPGGVLGVCPSESDRPRAGTTFFDVAIVGHACPSFPLPSRGADSQAIRCRCGFAGPRRSGSQNRGSIARRPVTRQTTRYVARAVFAYGRAFFRWTSLAGAPPFDISPTSAWVSSGCLCRPGGRRGPFWRTVCQCGSRSLRFAPATDRRCCISSRICSGAGTVRDLACISAGKLEFKGFSCIDNLRCRPSSCRLAPASGLENSAPRRGGGQAARDPAHLSWAF